MSDLGPVKTKGGKRVTCPQCGRSFKNYFGMNFHKKYYCKMAVERARLSRHDQ